MPSVEAGQVDFNGGAAVSGVSGAVLASVGAVSGVDSVGVMAGVMAAIVV